MRAPSFGGLDSRPTLTSSSRSAAEATGPIDATRVRFKDSRSVRCLVELLRNGEQIAHLLGVGEHHRVHLAALERADQALERPRCPPAATSGRSGSRSPARRAPRARGRARRSRCRSAGRSRARPSAATSSMLSRISLVVNGSAALRSMRTPRERSAPVGLGPRAATMLSQAVEKRLGQPQRIGRGEQRPRADAGLEDEQLRRLLLERAHQRADLLRARGRAARRAPARGTARRRAARTSSASCSPSRLSRIAMLLRLHAFDCECSFRCAFKSSADLQREQHEQRPQRRAERHRARSRRG